MDRKTMKDIIECLVEELRELPDGTELTTCQLLTLCGYNVAEIDHMSELFDIDRELYKAARRAHITLDSSAYDNMSIGLPYSIPFVVRNIRAQIKCPRCGSTDTARVFYGMPAFSDELQVKLKAKKVRLGGCLMSPWNPKRYCNRCKKSFGAEPSIGSGEKTEPLAEQVIGVEFSRHSFFRFYTVSVKKSKKGVFVKVQSNMEDVGMVVRDYKISQKKWDALATSLYHDLYLNDWKRRLDNTLVLNGVAIAGGERWSLTVKLAGGRKRTYSGYNAYPPYWDELVKLLKPFMKPGK